MATINAIGSQMPIQVAKGGLGVGTLTQYGVLVGAGTGAVGALSVGTDGQVLLGVSAGNPVFATLTSTGSTITFTPGAGTLNLEAVATGLAWSEATNATLALVVNNGYIMNRATAITATLPVTAAQGTIIELCGKGAGLSVVAQNALQSINFGDVSTTVGVGGSLTATNQYDTLRLLCTVADTTWTVLSGVGNWTIV